MTATEVHWWLNLSSFFGILVLSVPAWSLNFRRKKLKEILQALPQNAETFKDKVKAIVVDKRGRDIAEWRGIDEACLFAGYFLLLGSSFLRLLPW